MSAKIKIALVDDDHGIREVLKELLELLGYEVVTAMDGAAGVLLVLSERPDVVLSDVNMPGMNGYDFLSTLKRQIDGEDFPLFVFVSAKVEPEDVRKGLDLGAFAYLKKPFHHADLVELIEKGLSTKS